MKYEPHTSLSWMKFNDSELPPSWEVFKEGIEQNIKHGDEAGEGWELENYNWVIIKSGIFHSRTFFVGDIVRQNRQPTPVVVTPALIHASNPFVVPAKKAKINFTKYHLYAFSLVFIVFLAFLNITDNYQSDYVKEATTPHKSIQTKPIKQIVAQQFDDGGLQRFKALAQEYTSNYGSSLCAENGSCYGDISSLTYRPKTILIGGYFRSDGTYVRGHYKSTPSHSSTITWQSSNNIITSPNTISVESYYRSDGTYVRAHTRSKSK